jgi:hypothetical protein
MCGASLVALSFLMLPALYLPGWKPPRIGQFVRDKFTGRKHLSSKHLRRLKSLFTKQKQVRAGVPIAVAEVNETDDDEDPYLEALEDRRSGGNLIDVFRRLGESAEGQAKLFGLIATPPPPPRRRTLVTGAAAHLHAACQPRAHLTAVPSCCADEELVGPAPEGMFTLRHISHSVCKDLGMDNRTLATTLRGCATRCLLVNREATASRTCSHFGWIPQRQECYIYPSCARRVPFDDKVKLYEKSAPRPHRTRHLAYAPT